MFPFRFRFQCSPLLDHGVHSKVIPTSTAKRYVNNMGMHELWSVDEEGRWDTLDHWHCRKLLVFFIQYVHFFIIFP